jgi:ABC-type antimicrobial peptide transport system ATPase subunit
MKALLLALCLSVFAVPTFADDLASVTPDANIACGIPPIPPIGCRVGPCVCDAARRNCHYEFICH